MFHVKQDKEFLNQLNQRLNLVLSEGQIELLIKYAEAIKQWNKKIHLISKNDIEQIMLRHIVPSLFFVSFLIKQSGGAHLKILDVGSGAGLPGIVVSIASPSWEIDLLDSSRKKTLFLKRIKELLNLNINVYCERYEQFVTKAEIDYDWLLARAVAPLNKLLALVKPSLEQGTKLLTIKGENFETELAGVDQRYFKVWAYSESKVSELRNKKLVIVERSYG